MRFARRSQLEENDIMRCRTVDEKNGNELNCMTVQKPLKRQVVCNEVRLVVNDQTQQVAYRVIDAPAPFAAERGFVDTYGIAAYRKGRKLCQIADITADRSSLERLVEICNREGLSLCHLYDVVEDFWEGQNRRIFRRFIKKSEKRLYKRVKDML